MKLKTRSLKIVGLALLIIASSVAVSQEAREKTLKEVIDIQSRHEGELFKLPGVHGVGIGKEEGKFVLQVYVSEGAKTDQIPKSIEGLPINVIVSGEFYALASDNTKSEGMLLVLNKVDNTLSFIDVNSKEELGQANTGEGPHEIAVDGSGNYAYVSNYGVSGKPGNSISVISIARKEEAGKIDLGDYKRPHGILISKDGKRLYVTCEANRALVIVDLEKKKVLAHISTNQDVSHMVVAAPDESKAYITNIGSDSVTVVDLNRNVFLTNIHLSKAPEGLDISPDGKTLYVANKGSDTLSVIDTATNKVIKTVPTGSLPIRVKVTKGAGRFVLISDTRGGEVLVLDRSMYKEVARIKTGGKMPIGLVLDPSNRYLYVANSGSNMVSVVEMGTWKLVGEIKTGNEPDGLAYVPK